MKKSLLVCFALTMFASTLTSCYNTQIYSGGMKVKEPVVKVNEEWNHHFIGGLVSGKNAKMSVDEFIDGRENYMIKTSTSFVNGLVGCVTFGIYTPTTTTYYVPLNSIGK